MHPAEKLVEELQAFSYPKHADLTDEADMVMKGGITSGVVYPLAVCELAKTRRFRNLGGSSAGGIAAGLAAAAELGRDTGGYARLAGLPLALGTDLLHLFQPSRETRSLFALLMAGMDKTWRKWLKLPAGLVRAAPSWFLRGFLAALLCGFWALLVAVGWPDGGDGGEVRRFVIALLFCAAPAAVIGLVLAAVGTGLTGTERLASNGYGLCRGSRGGAWPESKPGGVEPFTDWLFATFNDIAGRDRGAVVTFGDLWGDDPDDRRIRLEMMTTNVTFCRPVRMPFETNIYSFCRTELAAWFPKPVIEHLVAHARPADEDDKAWRCPDHDEELVRLPLAADVPVLLAIRMTLSFPLLISAVPLFAIDYGCDEDKQGPVRCWFSDGGISSNFPIHFFDALWPGRPTFGISLGPYPPASCRAERQDVYMRRKDRAAVPRVRNTESFPGFLAAIADTLQNWSDEGQAQLPGFRDRIAEVRHTEEEGGMNLNMSRETILDMCLRGHMAAEKLEGFDFEYHRRKRYESAMGRLDAVARDMLRKWDGNYRVLLADKPSAVGRTDALLEFVGRTAGEVPSPDFVKQEPRPVPDLRVTARF